MFLSGAGKAEACRRREFSSADCSLELFCSSLFVFPPRNPTKLALAKISRMLFTGFITGDPFFGSDLDSKRSFSLLGKIFSHLPKIWLTEERLCPFKPPTSILKRVLTPLPSSNSIMVCLMGSPEACWFLELDEGSTSGWNTNLVLLSILLSASWFEGDLASVSRQPLLTISSCLGRTRLWVMISVWAWPNNVSTLVLIFSRPPFGPLRFKDQKPNYLCKEIKWACEKCFYSSRHVRTPTNGFYCSRPPWLPSPVPLYLIITFLMLFKMGCFSVLCSHEKRTYSYFSSVHEEDFSPFSSLWERSFISSSVKERILPSLCSLWMRVVSCPVVKPRMLVILLTDLLYVEILWKSEDAVGIVSLIPIGLDTFSKSHDAEDAVTTLQLAAYNVVRPEILLAPRIFKPSDSLVNDLSNSQQFVSLSLSWFCFFVLIVAVRLAYRVMYDNVSIFVIV